MDLSALECGICFEFLQSAVEMKCCHILYCKGCVKEWKRKENSCPHCRSDLELKGYRHNIPIQRLTDCLPGIAKFAPKCGTGAQDMEWGSFWKNHQQCGCQWNVSDTTKKKEEGSRKRKGRRPAVESEEEETSANKVVKKVTKEKGVAEKPSSQTGRSLRTRRTPSKMLL